MTTLEDLYRARAGHDREQREDFLTAATGLLLSQNDFAFLAFLRMYGEDDWLPELVGHEEGVDRSCVEVLSQDFLYHQQSGALAGRADLRLVWRPHAGGRRELVVEAKVDDELKHTQPQGYLDALADGIHGHPEVRVVTLTRYDDDKHKWPKGHCTWARWRRELEGVEGPLASAIRAQIDLLDLGETRPLLRSELERHAAPAARVDDIDSAIRGVVPELVSGVRLRRAMASAPEEQWDADWDVGYSLEWTDADALSQRVSFVGVGLSLRVEAGSVRAVGWLKPRSKGRRKWAKALVADERRPWVAERGSTWLIARLGSWSADDTPLTEVVRDAVFRARGALRLVDGRPERESIGHWTRVQSPSVRVFGGWAGQWTCRRLVEDVRLLDSARGAAEGLERAWIEGVKATLESGEHGVPCRPVYRKDQSLYELDGRVQVGVELDLDETAHPASAWLWARWLAGAQRAADQLKQLGWLEIEVEPRPRGRGMVTGRPPLRAEWEQVEGKTVEDWADQLATAVVAALG